MFTPFVRKGKKWRKCWQFHYTLVMGWSELTYYKIKKFQILLVENTVVYSFFNMCYNCRVIQLDTEKKMIFIIYAFPQKKFVCYWMLQHRIQLHIGRHFWCLYLSWWYFSTRNMYYMGHSFLDLCVYSEGFFPISHTFPFILDCHPDFVLRIFP